MRRTEAQIATDNKTLDDVIALGPGHAISWLRGAFHSHENSIIRLREDCDELSKALLEAIDRPLTVREAQMCRVCRVCRRPYGGAFILNCGEEFAHEACLPVNPVRHGLPEIVSDYCSI